MLFKKIPTSVSIEFRSPRKDSVARLSIPTSLVALLIGLTILSVAIVVSADTLSVPVTVDLKPETLNLKSKGKWIQANIVGYAYYFGYYDFDADDINNVKLWVTEIDGVPVGPYEISLDSEKIKPNISGKIAIKLDREDVINGINNALSTEVASPPVAVTLKLSFTADGVTFEGEDAIRVISP